MPHPVSIDVSPLVTGRNRLTTAFRLILAIPHLILVGGVGMGFGTASGGDNRTTVGSETGLLGAVAAFLAVVSWFTIVITGRQILGIRQFTAFYLRWRVRALSYVMLLEDDTRRSETRRIPRRSTSSIRRSRGTGSPSASGCSSRFRTSSCSCSS